MTCCPGVSPYSTSVLWPSLIPTRTGCGTARPPSGTITRALDVVGAVGALAAPAIQDVPDVPDVPDAAVGTVAPWLWANDSAAAGTKTASLCRSAVMVTLAVIPGSNCPDDAGRGS